MLGSAQAIAKPKPFTKGKQNMSQCVCFVTTMNHISYF